jgi:hypothetical protein
MMAALVTMSFLRTLIGVLPAALLAIWLYEYSIFDMGLPLIAFFVNLIVMGWSIGLIVCGLLMRWGLGAESLAWLAIFALAPLSAIYHAALLARAGAGPDMAVLNLGGVANITWTDGAGTLVAFDTGPANAPLNDFVRAAGLGDMDREGALVMINDGYVSILSRCTGYEGSQTPSRPLSK